MENMSLSKEFAGYKKQVEKCGLYLSKLDELNEFYTITLTEEHYKKLGRKNFPKNPTTTETKEITARQFACYITSIGFFGDRITKNYTQLGYVVTELTCKSPDDELKIVRKFKYAYKA